MHAFARSMGICIYLDNVFFFWNKDQLSTIIIITININITDTITDVLIMLELLAFPLSLFFFRFSLMSSVGIPLAVFLLINQISSLIAKDAYRYQTYISK